MLYVPCRVNVSFNVTLIYFQLIERTGNYRTELYQRSSNGSKLLLLVGDGDSLLSRFDYDKSKSPSVQVLGINIKFTYSEESLIVLLKIFPGRCKELHFVIHVFLLAVGTPKTSQKIGGACSPQKKFMLRISFSFFFCVKLYVVIRSRKIKSSQKIGLTPQNLCVTLVVFETVWKNLRN